MRPCEEYQVWISAMTDEALDREERAELGEHLASCRDCAAFHAALRAVSGAMEPEDLPEGLHARIMDSVRASAPKGKLTWLRPTLSVAACLVVVASCVLILRPLYAPAGGTVLSDAAAGGSTSAGAAIESVAASDASAADNGSMRAGKDAGTADGSASMYDMETGPAEEPEEAAEPTVYAVAEYAEEDVPDDLKLELQVDALLPDQGEAVATVVSDPVRNFSEGTTLNVYFTDEGLSGELTPGDHILVLYDHWSEAEDGSMTRVYADTVELLTQ